MLRGVHSFVAAKWVVRLRPGAGDVANQVRQVVNSLDAGQPLQEFTSMAAVVSRTMQMERFLMILLGAFAVLTLAMVASGLYGTLAYGVAQRRQEIGIRMAMGANWRSVAGMVVRSGLSQVAIGLATGLIAAYLLTGLMTGFLFGVPPLDPASLAASALVLLLVSALASAGPSLNAVRTDPLQTLRTE
jgi:putative ABC transport system permease protein